MYRPQKTESQKVGPFNCYISLNPVFHQCLVESLNHIFKYK